MKGEMVHEVSMRGKKSGERGGEMGESDSWMLAASARHFSFRNLFIINCFSETYENLLVYREKNYC